MQRNNKNGAQTILTVVCTDDEIMAALSAAPKGYVLQRSAKDEINVCFLLQNGTLAKETFIKNTDGQYTAKKTVNAIYKISLESTLNSLISGGTKHNLTQAVLDNQQTANNAMTRMISLLNSAFPQHVVDTMYDTQSKNYLVTLNCSLAFGEITVMKMKNGEDGFRYQNKEFSFNALTSKLQSEIPAVYTQLNNESAELKITRALNQEFSGQYFNCFKVQPGNEILIQKDYEAFIGGIVLRTDKNGQPQVDYQQQKGLALDKFIELLVRDVRAALAVNEQRTMSRSDSTNTFYTNASVLGDQQNASNSASTSSTSRASNSKKTSTIYEDPSALASNKAAPFASYGVFEDIDELLKRDKPKPSSTIYDDPSVLASPTNPASSSSTST